MEKIHTSPLLALYCEVYDQSLGWNQLPQCCVYSKQRLKNGFGIKFVILVMNPKKTSKMDRKWLWLESVIAESWEMD